MWDIMWKGITKKGTPAFQNPELTRRAIQEGNIQIGASRDFDVGRIQRDLQKLFEASKGIPGAQQATWALKEFNKAWDRALWEYLHDGFKIYGFEHLANKHNKAKMTDKQYKETMHEVGQLVNDTYGGQNYDVLGISPVQQRVARAFLLSPDWTLSTIRQALAPTGVGALYKNNNFWKLGGKNPVNARRRHGTAFWIKAAVQYGVMINLLNVVSRKNDIKENPELYSDEERAMLDVNIKDIDISNPNELNAYLEKLRKFSMAGNTLGHKTHLFDGRYEDGSERYVRWGKQFREFPELLFDDEGLSFPKPVLKKLGGKANPLLQLNVQAFTGKTLSGYENYDMRDKKGWEYTKGLMLTIAKSALPYSSGNFFRDDKQWRPLDIMMPASKGMSGYQAERLFFKGITAQDSAYVAEVYHGAVRNNLDAYSLFETAMGRHDRTMNASDKALGKDIKELEKQMKAETDPGKKAAIDQRLRKMESKRRAVEIARSNMDRAMEQMRRYTIQYNEREVEAGEAKKTKEQKD